MDEKQLEQQIDRQLNRLWNWWGQRKLARERATVLGYHMDLECGKYKVLRFQRCAGCGGTFDKDETQVDHISPVVDPAVGNVRTASGRRDWNRFIDRKFCAVENLQVLCEGCHGAKTGSENRRRRR